MIRSLPLALMLLAVAPVRQPVVVDYAGSLVTPMEGPVAAALAKRGITFSGEARGSKALAHLIDSGLLRPDVFISADASLVRDMQARGLIATATTFGSATLVLGYARTSPDRARFAQAAAGRLSVADLLRTPGLRIGRTDPALDPKGVFTQTSLRILGLSPHLGATYPEEDLLVRLETGVVDCAFLYSTEAIARHIPFISLPKPASLSGKITFTLAVMKAAPHPAAARSFAAFILHGGGRRILEAAGLRYF